MVRRKLQKSADRQKQWPLTPEELTEMLDRGPFRIFTTSSTTPSITLLYGYAVTSSHTTAIKIWSLANDWESLITREPSPKQAVMGLVINRMT